MILFRALYGALWAITFLNGTLYWVLFGEQLGRIETNQDDEDGFTSVCLVFLPTVLMSIGYTIMYVQLDELNKNSRM